MSTSPEAALVLTLAAVHAQFVKRIDQALSVHGISFTELLVMHQLGAAPSQALRRVDLAQRVGLSASGVTRLLLPMEKTGLVRKERNRRDARVSLVKLSAAGQRVLAEALSSLDQCARQLTAALDSKQLERATALNSLLLQLY